MNKTWKFKSYKGEITDILREDANYVSRLNMNNILLRFIEV